MLSGKDRAKDNNPVCLSEQAGGTSDSANVKPKIRMESLGAGIIKKGRH
jgi:hypothetical protein